MLNHEEVGNSAKEVSKDMSAILVQNQTCEQMRSFMKLYSTNKLFTAIPREVQKHVESCQNCAKALQVRVHVKNLLRGKLL